MIDSLCLLPLLSLSFSLIRLWFQSLSIRSTALPSSCSEDDGALYLDEEQGWSLTVCLFACLFFWKWSTTDFLFFRCFPFLSFPYFLFLFLSFVFCFLFLFFLLSFVSSSPSRFSFSSLYRADHRVSFCSLLLFFSRFSCSCLSDSGVGALSCLCSCRRRARSRSLCYKPREPHWSSTHSRHYQRGKDLKQGRRQGKEQGREKGVTVSSPRARRERSMPFEVSHHPRGTNASFLFEMISLSLTECHVPAVCICLAVSFCSPLLSGLRSLSLLSLTLISSSVHASDRCVNFVPLQWERTSKLLRLVLGFPSSWSSLVSFSVSLARLLFACYCHAVHQFSPYFLLVSCIALLF